MDELTAASRLPNVIERDKDSKIMGRTHGALGLTARGICGRTIIRVREAHAPASAAPPGKCDERPSHLHGSSGTQVDGTGPPCPSALREQRVVSPLSRLEHDHRVHRQHGRSRSHSRRVEIVGSDRSLETNSRALGDVPGEPRGAVQIRVTATDHLHRVRAGGPGRRGLCRRSESDD